jgi:hypothetical protein
VKDAVNSHQEALKKKRTRRNLTEEENPDLAQGNSKAMILKNEEVFDYRLVLDETIVSFFFGMLNHFFAIDRSRTSYLWRKMVQHPKTFRSTHEPRTCLRL